MPIPQWLRKFPNPLPNYGECGGASADCSTPKPIDKMDKLFLKHDKDLEYADGADDPENKKRLRRIADRDLALGLRGKFGTLEPYRRPVYGHVYNFFAKLIFRP